MLQILSFIPYTAHAIPFLVAGFLYPPGDYSRAAQITGDLLAQPALRAAGGTAARADVENWGWTAATQKLRAQQYQHAIQRNLRRRV